MNHAALRPTLLVLALAAGLGGCVSLFPNAKPAQMYRLQIAQASAPAAASAGARMAVIRGGVTFPSDVAGDQILTFTGEEAAFIASARWVEPAALMFNEALSSAFDAPGAPRLAGRGEALGAPTTLQLEVRKFQVDYDKGPAAAPTIEVQVHAMLIRNADRSLVADKMFDVAQPADDNRVTAIVAAFDAAVGQTLSGIRDWTATSAGAVKS